MTWPLTRSELEAVLVPVEQARGLPITAYTDARVFALEVRAILARGWVCAGREEEVDKPGAWVHVPHGCATLVVVRGADLLLRAFHNVCRHRAATLVEEQAGRTGHFVCPYHGWTYELDGRLRAAPFTFEGFERSAHGLVPARVAAWHGFVFVSADADAPPLERFIGAAPRWLVEAELGPLLRARRADYEIGANWKLVVENFQESHHFKLVHPALERLTPYARAESVLGAGPWLGGLMDLVDDAETVSTSGRRRGRPFLAAPRDRRRVCDALLFPTLLTSLQPDYLLSYRLHPVAVDRTRVVSEIFVHPAVPRDSQGAGELYAFWDRVNAEDRAVCERQQRGLASPAARRPLFTSVEDGVHAFDVMVARALLAALDAELDAPTAGPTGVPGPPAGLIAGPTGVPGPPAGLIAGPTGVPGPPAGLIAGPTGVPGPPAGTPAGPDAVRDT